METGNESAITYEQVKNISLDQYRIIDSEWAEPAVVALANQGILPAEYGKALFSKSN
jgi:hypothetical protein